MVHVILCYGLHVAFELCKLTHWSPKRIPDINGILRVILCAACSRSRETQPAGCIPMVPGLLWNNNESPSWATDILLDNFGGSKNE